MYTEIVVAYKCQMEYEFSSAYICIRACTGAAKAINDFLDRDSTRDGVPMVRLFLQKEHLILTCQTNNHSRNDQCARNPNIINVQVHSYFSHRNMFT
jgi:uncharacterized protein YjaG (DUF416 family)